MVLRSLVCCGKTQQEFKRIARPYAWVVLVWNVRDIESPLIHDDENLLLTYSNDYANSHAKKLDKVVMDTFFNGHTNKTTAFKIFIISIRKGFKGRLLSTSFIPGSDQAKYKQMIQLKNIFLRYEKMGQSNFYTKPICIILKLPRIC